MRRVCSVMQSWTRPRAIRSVAINTLRTVMSPLERLNLPKEGPPA